MAALRGSTNGYQLSAYDVDLQDDPPLTGFSARTKPKEFVAKARAIIELVKLTKLKVSLEDFVVTRTAAGDLSRETPVEWRYTTTVGHGNHQAVWTLIVDMDIVAPGQAGNGPDRTHVGYSCWKNGFDAVPRINGHIFVEYLPASR
ncbi:MULTISPECIES: hypothetical protein [Stenotrophomonas]|uniref:Uncharacterized protein n=1 Tax=Stenotrophomonas maltophilia TaxID=40324 RepID=A0AAI9FWD3_STEMA|nr:hypothetical protein [Stenotrophomonas maltophilia]UUS15216.1 hypothetical protein NMB32_04755 [Stenotrophomonas sp. CD2]AWT16769.1 hypothetical protein DM611_21990 [Stenotrophomonas maltophilia]EKT4094120.1 hypothetical protein [Stenotrophomonas maltophilia]MBA0361503.1 hypothetical protein [Stenotrophomonas maltophilia]HEL5043987.1 hypothetical protein [Stenotrophomonas maltophilia]